jgi:ComF family protein
LPLTEFDFVTENPVDRIFYGRIPICKASSFLYFYENGIVRNLMHHLKYRNQPQIGDFLGRWYGQILWEDPGLPFVDLVVPVPLHPRKFRKRGYNQVSGFGRKLAAKLGTPMREDVLEKVIQTRTQTQKSRIFRWKHQSPQFRVLKGELLQGKKVLLVDDVITTGATLEACAQALKSAANVEIYIATIAMVP